MEEIQIGPKSFISARRASELTGYAQDYIGQLARAKKIAAERVGKLWYVLKDEILEHKRLSDIARASERELRARNGHRKADVPVAKEPPPMQPREETVNSFLYAPDNAPLIPLLLKEEREERFVEEPIPTAPPADASDSIPTPYFDIPKKGKIFPQSSFLHATGAVALSVFIFVGAGFAALTSTDLEIAFPDVEEIADTVAAVDVADVIPGKKVFEDFIVDTNEFISGELFAGTQKWTEIFSSVSLSRESLKSFFERFSSSLTRTRSLSLAFDVRDSAESIATSFYCALSGLLGEGCEREETVTGLAQSAEEGRKKLLGQLSTTSPTEDAPTGGGLADVPPPVPTAPSGPVYVTQSPVIERVIERAIKETVVISGVSESLLAQKLSALENALKAQIYGISATPSNSFSTIIQAIAHSNKIDQLNDVTISNSTLSNVTIGGTSTFNAGKVTATDGTFSGSVSVGGSVTISGSNISTVANTLSIDTDTLYVDAANNRVGIGTTSPYAKLSVAGEVVGAYFTATSTTATSSFAGPLSLTAIPSGTHTFSSWSIGVSGSNPTLSSVSINPGSAAADSNLLGIAVAGSAKFLIDAEGDVFANSLTAVGGTTLSTTTASTFSVENTSTFGDATTTDITYFNSRIGTSFIPTVNNALDLGDGTNSLAWRTGYFATSIGVGTTSPYAALSVVGEAVARNFTATSTTAVSSFQQLLANSSTTLQSFTFTNATGTNATSTNFFATTASSTNFFATTGNVGSLTAGSLTVSALTGPLQALSGVVSASSTLSVAYGGTGTSTPGGFLFGPNDGRLLATTTISQNFLDAAVILSNEIDTSSELAAILGDETGTGALVFGTSPTLTTPVLANFTNVALSVDGSGTVIGTTTPSFARIIATSTSATSTFAGGLAIETSGFVYDYSSNRVGIGTAAPTVALDVTGQVTASATSTATYFAASSLGAVGSPTFTFSGDTNTGVWSSAADTLNFSTGGTERARFDSSGNFGIGTTTPWRKLSVTDTSAQLATAYDSTRYTTFSTDSVGDLTIDAQGGDAFLLDENLFVCTGGACPSGTPSGTGNLVVETALGIASSTPWGVLSVEQGTETYSFVVANQGSTTPSLVVNGVNGNGRVGIGSSTPFAKLSIGADGAVVTTEKALTDGATISVSWTDGNQQKVTLGGNRTINFSSYIGGQTLRLVVCQDATGSRTVTWDSAVLWGGGTAPTLTTTANKCDVLTFLASTATSTLKIFGSSVLNF